MRAGWQVNVPLNIVPRLIEKPMGKLMHLSALVLRENRTSWPQQFSECWSFEAYIK